MAEKKHGNPIQSGSMYLAWSNTRMAYVALRWAKAVGFIALNGVAGSIVYQTFNYTSHRQMFSLAFISLMMTGLNWVWLRLTRRTNAWIAFYVRKLEEMELASGTESGVLMFSDKEYLSRPQDKKGDKISASKHMNEMAVIILVIWFGFFLACLGSAIYLVGKGQSSLPVVIQK